MSIAPSKPPFTEKQGQYLAFIHTYVLLNGRPPAEADMERYFRVTPPSVHRMVVELERRGLIRRRPGVPRSIALTVSPERLPQLRPQSIETSVSRY
jgi:Mn-dependent DtxR family transcriptional regulator